MGARFQPFVVLTFLVIGVTLANAVRVWNDRHQSLDPHSVSIIEHKQKIPNEAQDARFRYHYELFGRDNDPSKGRIDLYVPEANKDEELRFLEMIETVQQGLNRQDNRSLLSARQQEDSIFLELGVSISSSDRLGDAPLTPASMNSTDDAHMVALALYNHRDTQYMGKVSHLYHLSLPSSLFSPYYIYLSATERSLPLPFSFLTLFI